MASVLRQPIIPLGQSGIQPLPGKESKPVMIISSASTTVSLQTTIHGSLTLTGPSRQHGEEFMLSFMALNHTFRSCSGHMSQNKLLSGVFFYLNILSF